MYPTIHPNPANVSTPIVALTNSSRTGPRTERFLPCNRDFQWQHTGLVLRESQVCINRKCTECSAQCIRENKCIFFICLLFWQRKNIYIYTTSSVKESILLPKVCTSVIIFIGVYLWILITPLLRRKHLMKRYKRLNKKQRPSALECSISMMLPQL